MRNCKNGDPKLNHIHSIARRHEHNNELRHKQKIKIKQQYSTCGVHDAEHAAGEAGTQERTIGRPGHIEGVTCALDLA